MKRPYFLLTNANRYSGSSNNDLVFPSDSLVVTLASTNYVSGQAVILVSDALNATVFADTIEAHETVVLTHLKKGRPKRCTIEFTNFTAKLAFVVVGQ